MAEHPALSGRRAFLVEQSGHFVVVAGPSLQSALAALEHAQLAHAGALQQLQRAVVVGADIRRLVSIARQRHRRAGFHAHLKQRGRRIQLLRALAQPRGRHLDRDARLGDPVDRKLVVAAQIAFGERALTTPHLHEVGVGENVEQPAARGLTEREGDREARDPVPVDVLSLVTAVVAGVAATGTRIDVEVADLGDATVRIAEPAEVEQVLHNLVENAVKHAAPGTPVEITVSRLEPWIEVAISNDGQPIAAEDVPKIFRKYGRATDQRRGSGIGLYLARRLARANGGDVRHRVRPGGGATFVLRLPLARLG